MNRSSEAQHQRMTETPMPRLILSLALPTVASQLISILYNTADTYFVSQISTSAAAAVGVVFSLMSIIQAFGYGMGMGANSLISRCLGAKRDYDAHRYGNSAFAAALVFGLLLLIGGLLTLEPLMHLLGATETILPYAAAYARYILLGAPILCASFVLNNILRSEGEAVLAMVGLCTGGILNIVLDPLLIFALDLGIAGAAIATVLSQCISFCILLSAFLRGKGAIRLGLRWVSRDPWDYVRIFRTGLPTICRQGMASLASALMNVQAAAFGDAAVAAMTISYKVYLWVRSAIIGIGQGFQPVAGYNYGDKRYRRVREAFRFSTILGTIVCSAAALILAAQAETILGWFRDDPAVIRIGAQALRYACIVMPFLAYSTYVNQLYQCLGFSAQATFLACCRQGVFYLPLILLLPALCGVTGVELTQPAADFLTFLLSIPFQIRFYRRWLRVEEKS